MPASILIVDDESGIRESLGASLRDEGYDVEAVASGEECLERVEQRTFDLLLLDVWLKKMDGLQVLERMQPVDGAPIVVMISGHANIETAVRATKLGAFDFIEKPLSLGKVILVVRNAIEYLRLGDENRRLRAELGERNQILGGSVQMKALRQQIALTAPTNGRVLIFGESGTGKELVARSLHASSTRSAAPLLWKSTARRFPKNSSNRKCLDIAKAALRAPARIRSENSKRPMAARCFWTKWAT